MPTYEYRCLKCREIFERIQRISAPSLTECPFCSGRVERIITGGSGLLFKGSGFHITDYRSDSYKKDASRDKQSDSKPSVSSGDSGKSSTGDEKPK
jgi:putative FmdB family regulatory protein